MHCCCSVWCHCIFMGSVQQHVQRVQGRIASNHVNYTAPLDFKEMNPLRWEGPGLALVSSNDLQTYHTLLCLLQKWQCMGKDSEQSLHWIIFVCSLCQWSNTSVFLATLCINIVGWKTKDEGEPFIFKVEYVV